MPTRGRTLISSVARETISLTILTSAGPTTAAKTVVPPVARRTRQYPLRNEEGEGNGYRKSIWRNRRGGRGLIA